MPPFDLCMYCCHTDKIILLWHDRKKCRLKIYLSKKMSILIYILSAYSLFTLIFSLSGYRIEPTTSYDKTRKNSNNSKIMHGHEHKVDSNKPNNTVKLLMFYLVTHWMIMLDASRSAFAVYCQEAYSPPFICYLTNGLNMDTKITVNKLTKTGKNIMFYHEKVFSTAI